MDDSSIGSKVCAGCGTEKPYTLEYFYGNKTARSGLYSECRECTRKKHAVVSLRNKRPRPEKDHSVRVCSKCRESKPATREFFSPALQKASGLHSQCKSCKALAARQRKAFGPPPPLVSVGLPDGYQVCTHCITLLPMERFPKNRQVRDGRSAHCKGCQTKKQMAAYIPAPPKAPSGMKKCARCETVLQAEPSNFGRNRWAGDGFNALCKTCYRAKSKGWAKANKEKVYHYAKRYRVRKRGAIGRHSLAEVHQQLHGQGSKCYWCKKPLKLSGKGKYHVDHIIPLVKGGADGIGNIACSCPECNSSKSGRMPSEWTGRLF